MLQVLIGLAVIWTIFQIQNDRFLSAVNLTNLLLQIAAVGMISIGVVLVLLLGEIDLSIGAVSGLAAGVMGVLTVKHGWSLTWHFWPACSSERPSVCSTASWSRASASRPSWSPSRAYWRFRGHSCGFWGRREPSTCPPSTITELTSTFYGAGVGWTLAVVVTAATLASGLMTRRRRLAADLEPPALAGILLRTVVVGVAVFVSVAILLSDRGIPLAVLILLVTVAGFAFITQRTRFGRHIYAVGGNAEAARRAGIKINRVRVMVFMLGSTLAAAGGILAASRLISVNQASGSGDLLLDAIAGPVIAGTSLFGGRGSVWTALLGALVIGSISNGMDLLGLNSDVKYMITGAVLLAAVTLDAIARRQRSQVQVT